MRQKAPFTFAVVMIVMIILAYQSDRKSDIDKEVFETKLMPYSSSPTKLILYTQKGTVNDSLEVFFNNIYINETIMEKLSEISEYSIEEYEKGIKQTMGSMFLVITDFNVNSEEITGERAVVSHTVTYDNNRTFSDETFFIFKDNRWYFDFEREIGLR